MARFTVRRRVDSFIELEAGSVQDALEKARLVLTEHFDHWQLQDVVLMPGQSESEGLIR